MKFPDPSAFLEFLKYGLTGVSLALAILAAIIVFSLVLRKTPPHKLVVSTVYWFFGFCILILTLTGGLIGMQSSSTDAEVKSLRETLSQRIQILETAATSGRTAIQRDNASREERSPTKEDVERLDGQLAALREITERLGYATNDLKKSPVSELSSSLKKMPLGERIVAIAEMHLGEPYDQGSFTSLADPNRNGPWNESYFVGWVIYRATGLIIGCRPPDPAITNCYSGFWIDPGPNTRKVAVQDAVATVGSFLVRLPPQPGGVAGHVVISDGKGGTIEAKNRESGVTRDTAQGRRWDFGVRLVAN